MLETAAPFVCCQRGEFLHHIKFCELVDMGHWQVQKSWANMSICTRCTRWIRKYRDPQLTDLCDALCGPKQCAIQKLRSLCPSENDVIRNYCRNTYLASATDTYTRMHVGCSSSIQWMYLRGADCVYSVDIFVFAHHISELQLNCSTNMFRYCQP